MRVCDDTSRGDGEALKHSRRGHAWRSYYVRVGNTGVGAHLAGRRATRGRRRAAAASRLRLFFPEKGEITATGRRTAPTATSRCPSVCCGPLARACECATRSLVACRRRSSRATGVEINPLTVSRETVGELGIAGVVSAAERNDRRLPPHARDASSACKAFLDAPWTRQHAKGAEEEWWWWDAAQRIHAARGGRTNRTSDALDSASRDGL